ncbi:MAG: DUF1080 domain-containing protein [Gemmataceae bacterium]
MRFSTVRSLAGLAVAALLFTSAFAADDGFKPLFNGKDFTGFDFVMSGSADPAKTWSVKDGVIDCTGKPNGYIVTKDSYSNYVLQVDIRYPEQAGNSGFLINCTGDPKVWPTCIEVQGHYNSICAIFPIGGAKGPRPPVDEAARKKAIKPHNEWNTVEIRVQNGAITSMLNGVKICESEPYELKKGPIGFQSEGVPVQFRNMRIKELN